MWSPRHWIWVIINEYWCSWTNIHPLKNQRIYGTTISIPYKMGRRYCDNYHFLDYFWHVPQKMWQKQTFFGVHTAYIFFLLKQKYTNPLDPNGFLLIKVLVRCLFLWMRLSGMELILYKIIPLLSPLFYLSCSSCTGWK